MHDSSHPILSVRPSGYHWRTAIRNADTKEELHRLALMILEEEEHLKNFVRSHGLFPPPLHEPHRIAAEDDRQALLALFRPDTQSTPSWSAADRR